MTDSKPATQRKPRTPKPSEAVEADLAAEELQRDVLDGLPALKPANRFRFNDRARFTKLQTAAAKQKVFDGEGALSFDLDTAEGLERYEAFLDFVDSIDLWAESIAENPGEYAKWAEGKGADVFLAIFMKYRRALGESNGS